VIVYVEVNTRTLIAVGLHWVLWLVRTSQKIMLLTSRVEAMVNYLSQRFYQKYQSVNCFCFLFMWCD